MLPFNFIVSASTATISEPSPRPPCHSTIISSQISTHSPKKAPLKVQSMTLNEKVGQILMVHFHGSSAKNNEEAKCLIQEIKVGGIIYYNWSNDLSSPEQVRELSLDLQSLAEKNSNPIQLLIAVDQEGGRVIRLSKGFTSCRSNQEIGLTGDPENAKKTAFTIGQELKSVGVNMNLAPVVDVNINPNNPVIGDRSFGADPELVSTFGKAALEGYREAHIIATLKHYPGHGDVTIDSHQDLPTINKSLDELNRIELIPFRALANSANAIMTAHLLIPAFDSENCSTISEKTLSYLKNEIGFRGVIVSDSLVMEGILKKCQTIDEASIRALNAGCDLLILGGKQLIGKNASLELTVDDIQRIHQSIMTAVKTGRIAESRLNDAVTKVLNLKKLN